MKIICSKQKLSEGINIVSKIVPSNTTMTLLQCILIRAENGEIRFTANDMEIGIETVIEGTIEIAGMVAVDAKKFAEMVRNLPDDDITIETDRDFILSFSCKSIRSNMTIVGVNGDEYTFLPDPDRIGEIAVSMYAFKDMISKTMFSVGSSEINKTLTGANVVVKGDQLRMKTLDGHRVSIRNLKLKESYPDFNVIIPSKTLNEVNRILPAETEKEINIAFCETHAIFEFEKTVVVSALISGQFIDVERMITKEYDTKVKINRKRLMECITRSMFYSKEGNKKPIVINISDMELELTIRSSDGNLDEVIDIEKEGKDVRIGFNPRFVFEALRVIEDEEVMLYLVNSRSPLYIRDDEEKYIYMILPINLNE